MTWKMACSIPSIHLVDVFGKNTKMKVDFSIFSIFSRQFSFVADPASCFMFAVVLSSQLS